MLDFRKIYDIINSKSTKKLVNKKIRLGGLFMKKGKKMPFNIKLKLLRMERHLTQDKVATDLGISRGCLANYETGKRQPDPEMLVKIAEYFGVLVDFLVNKDDVRNVTLNDQELKTYTKVNDYVKTYDDTLDLRSLSVVGKIAVVEYYYFIKENDEKRDSHP